VAYILLWFPKPSETFIFREVVNLWKMGLPLKVFTLYGELRKDLSPEMRAVSPRIDRLGIPLLKHLPGDIAYWAGRNSPTTGHLFRTVPMRRWRSLEVAGENLWAFLAGFHLARRFEAEGIEHIHAPWANGPATAAWVASRLTGIPFSFTGRARDIVPADGALPEKMRDAAFVRTNSRVNMEHLKRFSDGEARKIHMVYNGHPLSEFKEAPVAMESPFQILALGRFARFKGFDVLIRAVAMLQDRGLDFRLTIAGSGSRAAWFKYLAERLGVAPRVSFPGYIPHDRVSDLFCRADVFVMPSIVHSSGERDGIPNVMVEALLHRLPVVATDVAGIGEVIRNGETGFLVEQKDPQTLAEAIWRMTRDRKAALEMADTGRRFALEVFDPGRCHQEIFRLFTALYPPKRQREA